MNHVLRLDGKYFDLIASGEKTIECRLFDEKRRQISLGDTITFLYRDNSEKKCETLVIGLLRYRTFADLFRNRHPGQFGGSSPEQLTTEMSKFYSSEEEKENGIVGIHVERI